VKGEEKLLVVVIVSMGGRMYEKEEVAHTIDKWPTSSTPIQFDQHHHATTHYKPDLGLFPICLISMHTQINDCTHTAGETKKCPAPPS
jgi:hypothetical protein